MMIAKRILLIAGSLLIVVGLIAASTFHTRAHTMVEEQVIKLSAKKFEFSPSSIRVRKGVPVRLEISSEDRKHGFNLRAFGVRADVLPGKTSVVKFTPEKTGEFTFTCDVFCGDGHEDMEGSFVVTD